jgi:hypothetical protein
VSSFVLDTRKAIRRHSESFARFLPVIGPLDDIVVVALALRYAARQVPRDVLQAAWPGERRIIDRLLGTSPVDND